MLNINLTRQAAKFIQKLPPKQAKQIAKKITQLRQNPFPQDSKKLKG